MNEGLLQQFRKVCNKVIAHEAFKDILADGALFLSSFWDRVLFRAPLATESPKALARKP